MTTPTTTLKIGNTAYEPQFKTVHGGLVSAATMAIVTKAQSRITKARGLEKLLNLIAPYTQVSGEETTIKQATDAAVLAGAIPLAEALRFAKSEESLEAEDGEYFTEKLKAYSDILAGALDFKAMGLESLTGEQISESFTWEAIKEVAEDFLEFTGLKSKPSTTSEVSDASPQAETEIRKITKNPKQSKS